MEIVLKAFAGLGNQLFRYAALRYYAKRYGAEMSISVDPARFGFSYGYPRPFLLSHYAITVPLHERTVLERLLVTGKPWLRVALTPLRKALRAQVFIEDFSDAHSFLRDIPLERNVKRLYLNGFFHTGAMVEEVADVMRTELVLKAPAEGKNLEVLEQIRRSRHSVSIHVRRGDCTSPEADRVHLPLEYYLRALAIMQERLGDPTFFVFSDDMPFVKQYLPRNISKVFVEHNDDFSAHEDLRLMSACHHHIIANSTFSWWGAWLSPGTDKMVIAPRHWYGPTDSYWPELLPSSWLLIDAADAEEQESDPAMLQVNQA
jgi:hypothetical protein